jgi:meso-butanediol dehydrogenase / (S,S)-butanediol dehydrogenase / diacetyl reductase
MAKGVAIVTGSSQGLGKAIARRLSGDGFAVVINDIAAKQTQIDEVVEEIHSSGGKAVGIAADVTSRSEVQSLVNKAIDKLGEPLQVMVANAGLAHADGIFDLTEEHVQRILNVNIVGVFNCFVVAGKKMLEQRKGGKLIAASSVAAFKGMALVSAYTASKWAVRGLTQVQRNVSLIRRWTADQPSADICCRAGLNVQGPRETHQCMQHSDPWQRS